MSEKLSILKSNSQRKFLNISNYRSKPRRKDKGTRNEEKGSRGSVGSVGRRGAVETDY
jgi:hypothetical protein